MFSGFLSQAFIYLLAAVLAVPLAKRMGLSSLATVVSLPQLA